MLRLMKRRSGFGRLTVSLAVVLVLAGCGGKRNTYVVTPRYAADVYITLVSSVPLPQDLLDDMKGGGGATFVGRAQGPEVCKYSRKIWATGPYRSVSGKRLTVEVNGSNRRTAFSYCARIRDRMRFNVVGFAGVSPKTGISVVSAIGPVMMAPRQLSAEARLLGTPFYWSGEGLSLRVPAHHERLPLRSLSAKRRDPPCAGTGLPHRGHVPLRRGIRGTRAVRQRQGGARAAREHRVREAG